MFYDTTIRELSGTAARLGGTITQAAERAVAGQEGALMGVVYPEQDEPMAYAARQCGTRGDAVAPRHWATHQCDSTPGPDAA